MDEYIWNIIVTLGYISPLILALCIFLFIKSRRLCCSSKVLDEAIEVSVYGKIIFDNKGQFHKANTIAKQALPFLESGISTRLTKSQFLDYLYDHAADFDESIRNAILSDDGEDTLSFREVICSEAGKLFLVDGREGKSGITLFVLSNISMGRKREENIIKLNIFNHQLLQAIQATTSGIIISNPKEESNPILFANDAFCEFTNSKGRDLIGADWGVVMGLLPDPKEKERFLTALTQHKDIELELVKSSGDKERYFSMKLNPVVDVNGSIDLFIGVLSDVTLLKQRESEFFHAQKLESLGQLAAGVAHDFNNILSIIGGYSVMSSNILGDDHEQARGFLQKIDAASQRGAGLTRKMLTFSRHRVIAQTVIDTCDVLEEQRGLLIPLLDVTINFYLKMPPERGLNIKGSADSLGQILMNLSINARDAMSNGGTLGIELFVPLKEDIPSKVSDKVDAVEYVCFRVSDTGSGMDDKTLERIFDPFFSTKEQGKGTGLGMSVVYGLVQELGGDINISSTLGRGTDITLYIPRSNESVTKKITGNTTDLSSICLDGYTALVAEDEPDLLHLVTKMLEDLGLTVIGAGDGDEALMLQDDYLGDIDILLTDVVMPGMNGVKLAELVVALRPETKVIFMSGYPANGDMAPVELPGNACFVAKPVDYNNLARLLLQRLKEGAFEASDAISMPHWETTKLESDEDNV